MDERTALALRDRLPGALPEVALAPGRVNLIGEHVDYNEGWVLPLALDRHVAVALAPRDDGRLVVHAPALGTTRSVVLAELEEVATRARAGIRTPHGHVAGVAWALRAAGVDVTGADLLIEGDVPQGAGLSSSAALELAVARALVHAARASGRAAPAWDPVAMARACVLAEHTFVGVPCGPMDQIAAACGRADAALLLDCRTLTWEPVPLPADAAFLVLDTGVRRRLAAGAYAERRASCERALAALRARRPDLRALRDADLSLLDDVRAALDETTWRRARHVLEELPRPRQFAGALRAGDLPRAGALLNDSHRSLAELYEVSSPELDALCALARRQPGCHGARLTGAGFGGCGVALVDRARAADVAREVQARARHGGGGTGNGARGDAAAAEVSVFEVRASEGARIVSP